MEGTRRRKILNLRCQISRVFSFWCSDIKKEDTDLGGHGTEVRAKIT